MKLRTLALIGAGAYGLYRLSQQTDVPPGVQPLQPFDLERYLGRWYEIARAPNRWERGLSDVSADLHRRPDGRVGIVNRAFDPRAGRWRHAHATATPAQGADVAHLAVSFMWPVRASYIVLAIDDDYQHAVVCGHSHEHLWLLARAPAAEAAARASMLECARGAGFDVDGLLWVDQRRNLAARRY